MIKANFKAKPKRNPADLWLAEATLFGVCDPYLGKRRHPRFTWQVPVELDVHDPDGRQTQVYARTRDISAGGIGLECRQRIEPHSLVSIRIEGHDEAVEGYVTYCTQGLGKFLVGIVFAKGLAA